MQGDITKPGTLARAVERVGHVVFTAGVHRGRPSMETRIRIARADVAEGLVAAMDHSRASRATLDVAWGKGPLVDAWPALLERLTPDVVSSEVRP